MHVATYLAIWEDKFKRLGLKEGPQSLLLAEDLCLKEQRSHLNFGQAPSFVL
jgi:hypothetical protein